MLNAFVNQTLFRQSSLHLHHPHTHWSYLNHGYHRVESIRHWSLGKAWIWVELASSDWNHPTVLAQCRSSCVYCQHFLFVVIPILIHHQRLISNYATTPHIFPNWNKAQTFYFVKKECYNTLNNIQLSHFKGLGFSVPSFKAGQVVKRPGYTNIRIPTYKVLQYRTYFLIYNRVNNGNVIGAQLTLLSLDQLTSAPFSIRIRALCVSLW